MLRHLAHQGLTHNAWPEALRQNDLAFILIEVDGQWIARHFHPELSPGERNAIGSALSLWLVEKSEHLSERRLKQGRPQVHIYKHPLRNARIFLEPRQKHALYLLLDQLDNKKFYILGSLLIVFSLFLFVLLFILPGHVQKAQVAVELREVAPEAGPVAPYPEMRLATAEPTTLTWDGSRPGKRSQDTGVADGTSKNEATGESIFFAQENWNLPGFQGLDRIAGVEKSSFQQSAGYFRLADYAPEAGKGLMQYARRFLEEVTEIAGETEATLYLRNQRGQVEPCLGLRGELILGGSVLEQNRPSPVTINRLKEHHCLLSEDGQRAFFALLDGGDKLLGVLGLRSREALYNREDLSRINFLARKYGRLLYQALLHEQATTDPESTLKNGIEFQNDLARSLLERRNFRTPRMLLLLQFSIAAGDDEFRTIGPELRHIFAPDFELYRIASDAVALIGPALDDERITIRLQELLNRLNQFRGIALSAGSARLDEAIDRAQEWFDRARSALEESMAQGADRYTRREAATVAEFIGN